VPRHGPIFPQTLQPYPFPANHSGGSGDLHPVHRSSTRTRELETFFVWNQATNLADFKAGLQLFDFGSQNWAYSDDAGNIAYFASGEFPIREDINAGSLVGNPPYRGPRRYGRERMDSERPCCRRTSRVPYEIVPAAQVPQIENPPAHFFVNANNDPVGNTADNDPLNEALAGTGPYLGIGYDEFRAARITELIKSELNLIPTPPGHAARRRHDLVRGHAAHAGGRESARRTAARQILRHRRRRRQGHWAPRRRLASLVEQSHHRRAESSRRVDLQHADGLRHARRSRRAEARKTSSTASRRRSTTSRSGNW